MTTTRFKGMCFFPKLALPFFMFSPSPSHSITSPVHPTAINSTAPLACSSPTSEMARTMATEGHLRNGSMAQAGVARGHLRNGAGGAHLGGWGRGGRSERTSRGSRNGSVQLTKPHLQESAGDTIFLSLLFKPRTLSCVFRSPNGAIPVGDILTLSFLCFFSW
jgi:hypothetical protein